MTIILLAYHILPFIIKIISNYIRLTTLDINKSLLHQILSFDLITNLSVICLLWRAVFISWFHVLSPQKQTWFRVWARTAWLLALTACILPAGFKCFWFLVQFQYSKLKFLFLIKVRVFSFLFLFSIIVFGFVVISMNESLTGEDFPTMGLAVKLGYSWESCVKRSKVDFYVVIFIGNEFERVVDTDLSTCLSWGNWHLSGLAS